MWETNLYYVATCVCFLRTVEYDYDTCYSMDKSNLELLAEVSRETLGKVGPKISGGCGPSKSMLVPAIRFLSKTGLYRASHVFYISSK